MMFCLYWKEEDITYQELWNEIWKVNLGVGDLDKSRMKAKVMELFKEEDL